MKKGITPIIAIIILLLITVALSGAAWTFLQGFIFPQIQKSFIVPTGGAYCTQGIIKVYILNTGYQSDLSRDDFVIAAIDGTDLNLPNDLQIITLGTGESGKIMDYDCSVGGACSNAPSYSGYHSVDLGTSSTVQHLSVFCP
jgi:flagellin-like protein